MNLLKITNVNMFLHQKHIAVLLHLLEDVCLVLEGPLASFSEVTLQGWELVGAVPCTTGFSCVGGWFPGNIRETTSGCGRQVRQ